MRVSVARGLTPARAAAQHRRMQPQPHTGPWPALADDALHLWLLPHHAGQRSTGALRAGIARYLHLPEATLELRRSAAGQPQLATPPSTLRFAASHSGAWLLLGFLHSAGGDRNGPGSDRIGVDIETLRPRPNALALARRYFTAAEAQALAALPPAAQLDAFYRLWTAKEAQLKALGRGLAHGLDRVEFGFGATGLTLRTPTLTAADGASTSARDWHLRELRPLDGFRAAVAWHGIARDVQLRHWPH